MRFKTASGTEYILNDVETLIEFTDELPPSVGPKGIPANVSYKGSLARVSTKPMYDILGGGSFEATEDFHIVEFAHMPQLNSRFTYYHPVWAGCYSTAVTEIED